MHLLKKHVVEDTQHGENYRVYVLLEAVRPPDAIDLDAVAVNSLHEMLRRHAGPSFDQTGKHVGKIEALDELFTSNHVPGHDLDVAALDETSSPRGWERRTTRRETRWHQGRAGRHADLSPPSGGGGWGDPLKRPQGRLEGEIRDGLVSSEKARFEYGVVAGNVSETKQLREQMRTDRGESDDFDFGPSMEEILTRAKEETGLDPPTAPKQLRWAPLETLEVPVPTIPDQSPS